MTLTPRVRKLALTAHVTSSVGWLGAVAGFLALAVAGLTSQRAEMVRAAYLAMELIGWCVIVPFSLASLVSGLVVSLGTPWGVFRHYWVIAKLVIAIVATALLLVHMQPTSRLAGVAAQTTLSGTDLHGMRIQLVADAAAAVVVLLIATALSVYKPQGRTAYGRRKDEQLADGADGARPGSAAMRTPRWVYVSGIIVLILGLAFVIHHLAGGGFHGH